jgi:signal transduction histidine kinase
MAEDIHVVIPRNRAVEELSALASELLSRRNQILHAWRSAGDGSTERSIASSLSRAQFNDHIPAVLDCLGHTIQAWPGEQDELAEQNQTLRVCEHGLQRWQQGYQLRELIREWGFLQIAVNEELERYAAANTSLNPTVMPTARRAWTQLCAEGVTESATQYWRLHQAESAGHVNDLEQALEALRTVDRSRAEAWRTAAHDLRGSVTVVKGASTLLSGSGAQLSEPDRAEVGEMLGHSVASLHDMLEDLLSLARLEAGHEQRELTTFDAAILLRDFCTASQRIATDRGLFLKMDGPATLPVSGDKAKVLRILQNLLLNAVKYTQRGGLSITWGVDDTRGMDRWMFSVQDTGPGIDGNNAAPLAQEILNATDVANDAQQSTARGRAEHDPATTVRSQSETPPHNERPGEGIGLTIVKRLCELLEASLELATKPGQGSTFRLVFPRTYDS